MIKINQQENVIIPHEIYIYLFRKYIDKDRKTAIVWLRLLAEQQNGIYYEDINEIAEMLRLCRKTTIKYLGILKKEGLIYKNKTIYIVNMTPQKEILKDQIKKYNRKDKYLENKYLKAE